MDDKFNVKLNVEKESLEKFNNECNQIKIKVIKDIIKLSIEAGYLESEKFNEIEKKLIDNMVLQNKNKQHKNNDNKNK